jgi:hypothetical protein
MTPTTLYRVEHKFVASGIPDAVLVNVYADRALATEFADRIKANANDPDDEISVEISLLKGGHDGLPGTVFHVQEWTSRNGHILHRPMFATLKDAQDFAASIVADHPDACRYSRRLWSVDDAAGRPVWKLYIDEEVLQ